MISWSSSSPQSEPILPNIIYLHGFCSGPSSSKVRLFRQRFAALGIGLHCPDLNLPSFAGLTMTAMIDGVLAYAKENLANLAGTPTVLIGSSMGGALAYAQQNLPNLASTPTVLIGSSMGGALALHLANQHRQALNLSHLVLLAPAFSFWQNRQNELGEGGLEAWQSSGWHKFFHYGYGEERAVHWGLMEDLRRYDTYAVQTDLPIQIYQGFHDTAVDFRQCIRFARPRPNVQARLMNSDHQLLDQIDPIFKAARQFLSL
jgi:uncharacterized protein